MDIEWARDGDDGKPYIARARPETVAPQMAADVTIMRSVVPLFASCLSTCGVFIVEFLNLTRWLSNLTNVTCVARCMLQSTI